MTSRDFGFLTLRNTTAYQPNGLPVPQNTVFVTGTNGSAVFSSSMTLSSITVDTLNVKSLSSMIKTASSINANNISTGNLQANNAVINTLLSGSIEASTISVISTLNLLNPSGNPLELAWNDTTLYIDGHPVATDGTVSSVSSIFWDANTVGDGNIVNKHLGTGLTKYLVGIGYGKTSTINATLDVIYAGGSSQGNVLNISTANNNRLTVDSNGVVSITSSLSTNVINMTSGTISGLSTINGLAWPPVDDALWSRNDTDIYNDNPGNVGIGTNTPTTKLDVNGNISTSGNFTANGNVDIIQTGGHLRMTSQYNNCFIESSAPSGSGNLLYFTDVYANSTCVVMDTMNRQVGIATDSIGATLDVNGDIRVGPRTGNTSSFIVSLGSSGTTVGLPRSALIYGDGTDMSIVNQVNGSLTLGTNNTDKVTILSNGYVGIGKSNPVYELDVNGTIAADGLKMQTNGSLLTGTGSGLYIEDNIGMTFGNIGMTSVYTSIGTTSAYFYENIQLQSDGDITTSGNITVSGNTGITVDSGSITINSSTGLTINSGGINVDGDIITGSSITASDYINANGGLTVNSVNGITVNNNGGINVTNANVNANNFVQNSDIRLKNTINTIENPLSTLNNLRGVSYYLNSDSEKRQIGVIAQEVEQVLPEVVITDKSPDGFKGVSYGNITALLIEAVKELSAKVDSLMNK